MAKTHAEIEAELITVGEIRMNLMGELADAGVCFEPIETEDGTEIRVDLGPRHKANAKIKASLDKLYEIDQRFAELRDDFREISARNAESMKAEPPSRLLH